MSATRHVNAEIQETLERSALMAAVQRRGVTVAMVAVLAAIPWIGMRAVVPLAAAYLLFLVLKLPAVRGRMGVWGLVATWLVGECGLIGAVWLGDGPADMVISLMMVPMIIGSAVYPKRFVMAGTVLVGVVMVVVGWLDDPAYFASSPAGFVILPVIAMTIPFMVLSTRDAENMSRRESRVDSLTRVANRHALMLERDRLRSLGDGGEAVAVVLGDIDTFKSINDEHGHEVGDRVLAGVAWVITQAVGAQGQVFRYGGEEFLVVLVGEAAAQADAIAAVIRERVSRAPIAGVWTTISLGVAHAADGSSRFDELFSQADACLYVAKGDGGNQVEHASVLSASIAANASTPRSAARQVRPADARDVRDVLDRQHLATMTERQMERNLWAYGLILVSVAACFPIVGWHVFAPAVAGGLMLRFLQARVRRFSHPELAVATWWLGAQALNLWALTLADISAVQALTVVVPSVAGHYAALPRRVANVSIALLGAMTVAAGFAIDAAAVQQHPQVLLVAIALLATAGIAGRAVGDIASELRSDASHDPLTGLPNRTACFAALDQALVRAQSTGDAIAVIIGDLDHFKRVNDEHGHQAGDAVIAGVADCIAARIRPDVAFFRMGGEEFALLAPVSRARDAVALADRLRLAVRRAPIAGLAVTMSFGVTLADAEAPDASAVFSAADQALYLAKRAGRDCVRLGGTPDEGIPAPIPAAVR
jgi:diguanylate cyclase (GGDEF)-like protein